MSIVQIVLNSRSLILFFGNLILDHKIAAIRNEITP